MGEKKHPKRYAPRGLSEKALRVWRNITDGFTLREDEYELLESACREIDLIDSIQKAIDRDGLMLTGSMGQPVAHPLLARAAPSPSSDRAAPTRSRTAMLGRW